MTNEELVTKIQQGDSERILELWEHTEKFIALQARKYIEKTKLGSEWADDLTQAGYFALINAVANYDPEQGGASFLHYLTFHLKNAFREALGYRTERQSRDPIHSAASLDEPIIRDGEEFSLYDVYGEDDAGLEDAERRVFVEELRKILLREMDLLTKREANILQGIFWKQQTYAEVAEDLNLSVNSVRNQKARALEKLRRRGRRSGLVNFLEDRTPYYAKVGKAGFRTSHTSAVEYAVLKREKMERRFIDGQLDKFIRIYTNS